MYRSAVDVRTEQILLYCGTKQMTCSLNICCQAADKIVPVYLSNANKTCLSLCSACKSAKCND